MKKLSLILSLLAVFAISTMNAQSPAPTCKMEAGKCVITNADGTTTVVDAKDCAVKCATTASTTECAKKCSATATASNTCTKAGSAAKTVSTAAKSTTAQTVNFLPEAKEAKTCTSAKSSCCKKGAKGAKATKVAMKESGTK